MTREQLIVEIILAISTNDQKLLKLIRSAIPKGLEAQSDERLAYLHSILTAE